ncbi:MAG: hypothetical protein KDD94_08190 [Calditrichaeota bacterium]|nr:hypothetical protein [Calditrichota bacterium]
MKIVTVILILLISCSRNPGISIVSDAELQDIRDLHQNYRLFWLENDSTKVVNLFAQGGALIPPGNSGDFVSGKVAIGNWWFSASDDGTTYPITGFEYQKDSLIVIDSRTAIWEGVSAVSWNTVRNGQIISTAKSSSNFMTICTKINGEWKILRQIWNVRPEKS